MINVKQAVLTKLSFAILCFILSTGCTKKAKSQDNKELSQQLEAVTKELGALKASANNCEGEKCAALEKKVNEFETKLTEIGKFKNGNPEEQQKAIDELKEKIAALETADTEIQTKTDNLEKRVAALEADMTKLNDQMLEYGALLELCCDQKVDPAALNILKDYEKTKGLIDAIDVAISSNPNDPALTSMISELDNLIKKTQKKIDGYVTPPSAKGYKKVDFSKVKKHLDAMLESINKIKANLSPAQVTTGKKDLLNKKMADLATLLAKLKSASGILSGMGGSGGFGSGGSFGGICLAGSCSGGASGGSGIALVDLGDLLMNINLAYETIKDLLKDPEVIAALGSGLKDILTQLEKIRSEMDIEVSKIQTKITEYKTKGNAVSPIIQSQFVKYDNNNEDIKNLVKQQIPVNPPSPIEKPDYSQCTSHKVSIKVINATTKGALSGAAVTITNDSGFTLSQTTNSEGVTTFDNASLPGKLQISVKLNGFSNTSESHNLCKDDLNKNIMLSPIEGINEKSIRMILSWIDPQQPSDQKASNTARDVDSYLWTPDGNKIYYENRNSSRDPNLDVDETRWRGPETTTIKNPQSGTYLFSVVNFSNPTSSTALGNSQVKIEVYKGFSKIHTIEVPQGSGARFDVLKIVDGSIELIQKFSQDLSSVDTDK